MVRTQQITKYDNVIDSRDVIARIEELEYSEDAEELAALKALASEAEGYAPNWYGAQSDMRSEAPTEA